VNALKKMKRRIAALTSKLNGIEERHARASANDTPDGEPTQNSNAGNEFGGRRAMKKAKKE